MKLVFADTSYFLALFNTTDAYHDRALRWNRTADIRYVVTEFVLLELGNALSASKARSRFLTLTQYLRSDKSVDLVLLSREWLRRGESLFTARPDKEWSLTDCISFVVMTERKIHEALTTDHHFTQAGFRVLL